MDKAQNPIILSVRDMVGIGHRNTIPAHAWRVREETQRTSAAADGVLTWAPLGCKLHYLAQKVVLYCQLQDDLFVQLM
jgi:hypothetical protein